MGSIISPHSYGKDSCVFEWNNISDEKTRKRSSICSWGKKISLCPAGISWDVLERYSLVIGVSCQSCETHLDRISGTRRISHLRLGEKRNEKSGEFFLGRRRDVSQAFLGSGSERRSIDCEQCPSGIREGFSLSRSPFRHLSSSSPSRMAKDCPETFSSQIGQRNPRDLQGFFSPRRSKQQKKRPKREGCVFASCSKMKHDLGE